MNSRQSLRSPPTEILYVDGDRSLIIKPLEEKNAKAIFAAVEESRETLLPFMDWAHEENSVSSQLARIAKSRENYFQGKEYALAVFDPSGEFLMASGWLKGKNRNPRSLEIGYWTSLKHCNKGLATLVTQILVVVGFELMKSDRIEIVCNKQNRASRRVIEKCGFKFEVEMKNYFQEPSLEMVKNGYSLERSCLQYALLPEDREELTWYQRIKEKIKTC